MSENFRNEGIGEAKTGLEGGGRRGTGGICGEGAARSGTGGGPRETFGVKAGACGDSNPGGGLLSKPESAADAFSGNALDIGAAAGCASAGRWRFRVGIEIWRNCCCIR